MLVLVLAACGGAFDPLRHDDRPAVWVEFVEPDTLPDRVAFAGEHGLDVHLAFQEGEHDADWLATACEAAEEHDVAVMLWPLLAYDDGYWANQANADAFVAHTWDAVDLARRRCPRLDGVVVDMELPYDRAQELRALLDGGGTATDLAGFLLQGRDPDAFEAARGVYRQLCADLHDEGLRCSFTGLAPLADDPLDGDETIASSLWTPVVGIEWDEISVQVYRSLFDAYFSAALEDPTQRFGPGLAGGYAASAVLYWGDRAGIDLGTTGSVGIGVPAGLADAAALQADFAAALDAGIAADHVAIYSLEGLDGRDDAAAWVAVPEPAPPPPDPAAEEIRDLFRDLDLLGD